VHSSQNEQKSVNTALVETLGKLYSCESRVLTASCHILVLVAAGGLQQIAIERRAKLDELERIHRTGAEEDAFKQSSSSSSSFSSSALFSVISRAPEPAWFYASDHNRERRRGRARFEGFQRKLVKRGGKNKAFSEAGRSCPATNPKDSDVI
jgi:hypothetical protein